MVLNKAGEMVEEEWQKLPSRFDFLELDEYIIMPNHIHALLQIICRGEPCVRPKPCVRPEPCVRPGYYILPKPAIHSEVKGDHKDRPYGTISRSIGRIIQAYKSITTHQYIQQMNIFQWPEFQKRLWQRNYYENIIHNENELQQTREYIRGNPANWFLDEENPQR